MSEEKKGFFGRLREGLTKTRNNIVHGIDSVFGGFSNIDDDFYEELEEILIMGDIGVKATEEILDKLRDQVRENHIKEPADCKEFLIRNIKEQMQVGETAYEFEKEQSVVLVIGVNGVGKTTTVGKLAGQLKGQGRKVLIAAADTFRAAAGEQLSEWANRAGVDMIGASAGSDPASVVFDAVNAAKARNADVLLCDTAGRLHNKKNLMEELKKINRIIEREFPNAHRENLVVLDGTTGQNALQQAREFGEVADLTGIILTKMDGTAKGGIAVAIQSELNVPVKYIGVGETIEDLQKFNADEFVNALFDVKPDPSAEETSDEAVATQASAIETAAPETPVQETFAQETSESENIAPESFASETSEPEASAADAVPEKSFFSCLLGSTEDSNENDTSAVQSAEEDSPAEEVEKSKKRKWFFWK